MIWTYTVNDRSTDHAPGHTASQNLLFRNASHANAEAKPESVLSEGNRSDEVTCLHSPRMSWMAMERFGN